MTGVALVLFLMLAGLTGLIATVLLQYLMRENRVNSVRVIGGDEERMSAADPQFRETFQLLTNTRLYPGNKVEILLNGEQTYPRLLEDLRSAKRVINWHVFWVKPGKLADEVKAALVDRARNGVIVHVLFDYFGSYGIGEEYIDELKDAGAEVCFFRPLSWKLLYKVQQRMHIRAVIIDGETGYTGGFGIDDRWLGNGRSEGEWRDTNVRVQGPAVDQLQASFVTNWAESTGELLIGEEMFHPEDKQVGDVVCGILHTAPSIGSTNAERYYVVSISAAREKLYITNPYFVPDDDFRELLMDAAKRGVDVRVITPGENNDRLSVLYAGRAHFEELMEAGIRIYEYRTMVHAKTLVADAVWFSVGTINFDNRSVMLNDEVTLAGSDERIGKRMEEIFFSDLEYADEIDLEEFRKRSRLGRVREQFYRFLAPVL